MKKLLLSIALLGAMSAGMEAQELKFTYEGRDLANGEVITYTDYTVLSGSVTNGVTDRYSVIMIVPEVYIVCDEREDVSIQATSLSGQTIEICAGGECINGVNPLKPLVELQANVPVPLEAGMQLRLGPGQPVVIPDEEILIEAWYTYDEDKEDVIRLTIKLADPSGVESILADGSYIRINGKELAYEFGNPSSLSVYSISGKTIFSKQVSGAGKINLATLQKGVYVYKVAGKNSKAGKFVLR